jgi:hypothetical protein
LGLPSLFIVGLGVRKLFEVCLRHRTHICVLQTGSELVNSVEVAFGSEVDVGEAALVSALLADVHIN